MSNFDLTHKISPRDRQARKLVRALQPSSPARTSATAKLARGLGWFGIGLGLVELLAPRWVARTVGLGGRTALLQAVGIREVGTGIGLLLSADAPEPRTTSAWVRARVAGDALDLALLAGAAARPAPRGAHPVAAMAAVAGVGLLDWACASTLHREEDARRQTTDYSDRAGMRVVAPVPRGAALDGASPAPEPRAAVQPGL